MAKGVQISDRVNVQAILQTAIAPAAGFGKALFMIDSDEIPTDKRVVEVTRGDYADHFDSNGLAYACCQTHFSQKRVPDSLLLGLYVSDNGDNAPAIATLPDADRTLVTYTSISNGSMTVDKDGTDVDLTGLDFSGATAIDQIWTIIQTAIKSASTPDTNAFFGEDNFGRIALKLPDSVTGAGHTVGIKPLGTPSGTDIAVLLGYATEVSTAGIDKADVPTNINDLLNVDNTGYYIFAKFSNVKAEKEAEITAFCAKIESLEKIGIVLSDDTKIKDAADTTNIFAKMKALGYKRTAGIYYENIVSREKMFPDSAVLGCVIPAQEGTTKFAQEEIVGISISGYNAVLSEPETKAVTGHGGNVIERVGEVTYMFDGLTFGGEEIRIMLGRDWFVSRIREALFSYTIQQPLTAFDNETLTAIAGFIQDAGEKAIARRILVDTVERPFLVNLPDEDDFSQAERASHKMTAYDVFQAYLNSAVNEYKLVGTWTI